MREGERGGRREGEKGRNKGEEEGGEWEETCTANYHHRVLLHVHVHVLTGIEKLLVLITE